MAGSQVHDFESAKARLEEIADAVSDESMPLDDALDLFEEAVTLGLAVSDLVEEGIVVEDQTEEAAAEDAAVAQVPSDDSAAVFPSGASAAVSAIAE